MKKTLLAFAFLSAIPSFAAVVEFHIPAGTNNKAWNTSVNPIVANVGDTIHFVNDDSIRHRLHTNGAPCDHGPNFAAGATWDCVARSAFSSMADGPLYDHNFGDAAEVWIEVK